MIVLIFSVAAVGLLVVGLSLTLMVKGHHIDGEIATNRNMQALGINCAVHGGDGRSETGYAARRADSDGDCADICTSCTNSACHTPER